MDEVLTSSAVAQASAIRRREVSSEDLVAAHLERIAAVNPAINAVVQLNDAAVAQARAADDALARGESAGLFHGVPFTAKDWIETNDLVCAAGMTSRAHYVPKRDATVVARMRGAGAILLGKTNVQETNEVYGLTRNPYDLARSPGASSSGEAAIVGACGSPLGLGSDSGGSLRYPAHCCGVATLKPTTGRVPNTGHFPRIGASHDPRTVIGPLSRHVEDLWPALSVIAGVDWRDPSVAPVPLVEPRDAVVGWRIGFFVEMPGAVPDGTTQAMLSRAVEALAAAGASLEEVTPPRIDEAMPLTQTYWRRVQSVSWDGDWTPDKPTTLSADEIERSIYEWDRYRRAMTAFIEPFDALVCPTAESEAPMHGAMTRGAYLYTVPFSLVGWPVVTLRAGSAENGMPLGVQVVGRPWCEGDAIAVAREIERACGGWSQAGLAV